MRGNAYVAVISQAAEHSGGGLLADVPRTVHDCPAWPQPGLSPDLPAARPNLTYWPRLVAVSASAMSPAGAGRSGDVTACLTGCVP